ncbi:TetR/AcrR family transcriptional regulator C-terminal domain-containing protein [Streptomyces sp. RB6PN25]|uniref:TetR/AcrR family transcriptional regulator C-terminal domain-containing protein n=1 Tax=Streptomyces humicola TaxID=2953240 RepID=A0ABT1PSW0_9ACTN|nr:TetR/AcrR family transcriptional regulator C-terminal domain-containing protein [Streptomyces humicola]MCQ4080761.1 TetR/AcrR family transcriptional regulator C-terminal domain-containing protein [Streptomyces humicola]
MARQRNATRTNREPVTVERIANAAFELVEQDGLDALTMRKLADRLGIQAATLYWHVRDKHDLIDLLAEELFARFPLDDLPPDDNETESLYTFGQAFRHYLLERRDAARILSNRFVIGPHMLAILERLLGWLRAADLDERRSAQALIAIMAYIHGFVLWEITPMSGPVARGEPFPDYLADVRNELEQLSTSEFPHTVALAGYLTEQGNDERFSFGLRSLLNGMAQGAPEATDAS